MHFYASIINFTARANDGSRELRPAKFSYIFVFFFEVLRDETRDEDFLGEFYGEDEEKKIFSAIFQEETRKTFLRELFFERKRENVRTTYLRIINFSKNLQKWRFMH